MKSAFRAALTRAREGARLRPARRRGRQARWRSQLDGKPAELKHGAVVIAAITSCTNTSNPSVMLAAGLLARKAVRARPDACRRTSRPAWRPGSKVVTEYLRQAGLLPDLEALGFHLVGYGCTTCIGNSGPLPEAVSKAVHGRQAGGRGGAARATATSRAASTPT